MNYSQTHSSWQLRGNKTVFKHRTDVDETQANSKGTMLGHSSPYQRNKNIKTKGDSRSGFTHNIAKSPEIQEHHVLFSRGTGVPAQFISRDVR